MRGRSGEAAQLLRLGLASIVLTLAPAGIHAAGPLGADEHPGSAPPWAGRTCQEPTPRYPESRSLNDDAVSIAKVRIGNQRFESGHGGDGYQDHTRRTFTLHSGAREYLSLHPWYGVTEELTVYWLVWIDLNCDGDFDDTVAGAEELVAANPYFHRGSTVKGMFQTFLAVPVGHGGLTTRMRISLKQKAADDTAAPTSDEVFASGEVEDYTVRLVAPPPAPAGAPGRVRVDVDSPTTAMVAWDPVAGAAAYQVEYRDAEHPTWMSLDTFYLREDATETTMPLVTLAAGTRYVVRVRATNLGGASPFGPEVAFTTMAARGSPTRYPTVGLQPEAVPFRLGAGTRWRLWDPFVLYDDDDDLYKVWYTVWGGSEPGFYGNRVMGVGYAWSADGLEWTRQPGGHVLVPTPGSWDQDGLETVSVVKKDGVYFMWYLGKNYSPYRLQIGLATSPDGVRWTKHPGNPVLVPEQDFEGQNVKEPSVLWDDEAGLFKMWYNGMQGRVVRVGYATSPDGVSWTKLQGPVNGAGSAGWNHVHVVKAPGGGYQMYFLIAYSVYEAWSADGVHDWTLNPNGPVLRARTVNHIWNGAKHDFERLLAYGSPTVVFRDGAIRLYHMRTSTTATEYGDDSMRFGLAIGAAGGGGRIYVPVARTGQGR